MTLTIQALTFPNLQSNQKWQVFYSEQKKFSVELPRVPDLIADTSEMDFKEVFPFTEHMNTYIFSGKDEDNDETNHGILEFILSREKLSANEFYKHCETNLLWFDGDDKKIKYQKRSKQGKALIFDAEYSKFEMTGRVRMIKYKDAIFIISFSTRAKKGNDPKLIARVLNTFKLH